MSKEEHVNREHKDTLFRVLFNNKENALALYNAINQSSYDNPDDIIFTTLEDVIYIGIKNDLSFLIGYTMNLYEHQSTFNPNMPLRGFLYFAALYQGYIEENHLDLYSSTLLKLPMPQYVVFYNGEKEQEDREKLCLSDAFLPIAGKKPCLECEILMLNINIGHNKQIMEQCRVLYEYAVFIGKVRSYTAQGIKLKAAIARTADECMKEGILADLLKKNRAEVCNMLLREYDEAAHIANEKKISFEDGLEDGRRQVLLLVIQDDLNSGLSKEDIMTKLITRYQIPPEKAEEYFKEIQSA